VKRLAHGVAGVSGVLPRPEQREQRVTAVEAARGGDGEVDEKSRPLGLHQDRADLRTIRVAEVDGSQRAELDQRRPRGMGSAASTIP
jgi:hypothetical protein